MICKRLTSDLQDAWQAGDFATARRLNEALLPLHDAMFCETNPSPVKYAASLLGLCRADVRLPMVPLADASKARVRQAMEDFGLLSEAQAASAG